MSHSVCVSGCVLEGFGNATRIDYGTGHEMKFAAFLCCLMKMGVIPQDCAAALVVRVIIRWTLSLSLSLSLCTQTAW